VIFAHPTNGPKGGLGGPGITDRSDEVDEPCHSPNPPPFCSSEVAKTENRQIETSLTQPLNARLAAEDGTCMTACT
jgi:hypothetical protein